MTRVLIGSAMVIAIVGAITFLGVPLDAIQDVIAIVQGIQ